MVVFLAVLAITGWRIWTIFAPKPTPTQIAQELKQAFEAHNVAKIFALSSDESREAFNNDPALAQRIYDRYVWSSYPAETFKSGKIEEDGAGHVSLLFPLQDDPTPSVIAFVYSTDTTPKTDVLATIPFQAACFHHRASLKAMPKDEQLAVSRYAAVRFECKEMLNMGMKYLALDASRQPTYKEWLEYADRAVARLHAEKDAQEYVSRLERAGYKG
ncbi:MAG: hypothetical protein JSS72_08180 [Armatimonadetes bacterium]|nr:hypothetical protein [Armatimonadota bacterium]